MRKLTILKRSVSYPGNIGFEEMVNFYQKADPSDIEKMETFIKQGNWSRVKALFKKVLNVVLK